MASEKLNRGSLPINQCPWLGKIKSGDMLISIHTENSEAISHVKGLFKQAGAEDISSTGESEPPKRS